MKHVTRASKREQEEKPVQLHLEVFFCGRMFPTCIKGVVSLEKAGAFSGLAAFLAAVEVKVCF